MKIPFIKMHGLGNDFIIFDNIKNSYGVLLDDLAAGLIIAIFFFIYYEKFWWTRKINKDS